MRVVKCWAGGCKDGTVPIIMVGAKTSGAYSMFINDFPLVHFVLVGEHRALCCSVVVRFVIRKAPSALKFHESIPSSCFVG